MRITYMSIEELRNHPLRSLYQQSLSQSRQDKISSKKQEDDKLRSLAAGLLLKEAFSQAGKEHLYHKILVDDRGKPYIEEEGFYFNVSHGGEFAVCVVSNTPTACDIEPVRKRIPVKRTRIFSLAEEIYFQRSEEQEMTFFQLWTRKESLTKQIGKGIWMDFTKISFVESDSILDSIDCEGKIYFFREYQIASLDKEYILSICSDKSQFPKDLHLISCNCDEIIKRV